MSVTPEEAVEEFPIKDMQRVELRPGDVLVVTAQQGRMRSMEEVEHLADAMAEAFPDNRVIYLEGAGLSVVRPNPAP